CGPPRISVARPAHTPISTSTREVAATSAGRRTNGFIRTRRAVPGTGAARLAAAFMGATLNWTNNVAAAPIAVRSSLHVGRLRIRQLPHHFSVQTQFPRILRLAVHDILLG